MNKLITNPIVAGLWICLRKLELPPMTELDGNGCALLPGVLTPAECIEIAGLYADGNHFRSHIIWPDTASVPCERNLAEGYKLT
jgi:hypothetical protein